MNGGPVPPLLKKALSNSVALQSSRRFEIRRIRVERVIVLEQSEKALGRKSRDRPKPNCDGLLPPNRPRATSSGGSKSLNSHSKMTSAMSGTDMQLEYRRLL